MAASLPSLSFPLSSRRDRDVTGRSGDKLHCRWEGTASGEGHLARRPAATAASVVWVSPGDLSPSFVSPSPNPEIDGAGEPDAGNQRLGGSSHGSDQTATKDDADAPSNQSDPRTVTAPAREQCTESTPTSVSESSLRRTCKELGIKKRWSYPKRRKSSRLKSKFQKSSSSKNKIASSTKESSDSSEETSPPPQMEETSSTSMWENDVLIRHAIDDDGVDHMEAQPSPENTKLLFYGLMALTLEGLSNPDNETSMKKALSILENNLTLFSKEQAEQILVLSFDFTTLVRNWREYHSRSQTYNNPKPLDETEKIRDLVKTSERDEESLKEKYEELEKKEKELMQQLAAVQKEKAEVAEQRIQKSKETEDLMEKEANENIEERLTRIATTKLKKLSEQWTELRSSFI